MAIRITGGNACGRTIASPKGKIARPTSSKIRQAVFNILSEKIVNAKFLDIYSGSGIMGLEAMSRGAQELTFIELNRKLALSIESSLEILDYEASVIVKDARAALKNLENYYFDVIFADPPYQTNLAQSTIYQVSKNKLLAKTGILIIEHSVNTKLTFEKTALTKVDERTYGQTLITLSQYNED